MNRSWKLPIKTVSEANCSEHWTIKAKRHKYQKRIIWLWSLQNNIKAITLPVTIRLTRLAPGNGLDEEDNLRMAFKWIKDYVADQILPGLAPGRADGDKRIKWEYAQEKSNIMKIRIEIQRVISTRFEEN